jgi:hypothetical protein
MKDNPISAKEEAVAPFERPRPAFAWTGLFFRKPTVRFASLLSCLVVFCGFMGVAFAAHSALPGESLYPFKTGINEEVLSWVSFSNEAKAAYNVMLVQRRLEEIEKVAVRGQLSEKANDQASSLIKKRIAKANEHAGKAAQKKPALPTAVHSEIEASLFAHGFVLEGLANKHERGEVSQNIRKATAQVKEKIREAKQARETSESQIATKPAEEIKPSADLNLQKAKESLLYVKKSLDDKRKALTAKNYEKAIRNLLEAEEVLSVSEKDLEAGKYGEAFVNSQKVIRAVQETNIGIESALELDVEVFESTVDWGDPGEGEGTVQEEAGERESEPEDL